MSNDKYTPKPEHKFTFGLWTVGNRGRDPFGDAVRDTLPPLDAVELLAEVGAYGVNFHDNDLVPIDATAAERDRIVKEFTSGLRRQRHKGADGDRQPVLRSRFPRRRFHRKRRARFAPTRFRKRCGRWTSAPNSAPKIFVFWGGREGVETDACRRPDEAIKRLREAINFLCEYNHRPGLRLQVRVRGQAERAARRHLYGDDRRLSRLHPDARSSGHGRRKPRGGARADGRA